MRYEVLSHTADTGIVAHGESLGELFENAAYAMFDLMFDLRHLVPTVESEVVVGAVDYEDLMFVWLSELLLRSEIEDLVWCRFRVAVHEDRARAAVDGIASTGLVLRGPPIKAVTLHLLEVTQKPEGWRATVLFDV